MDKTSWEEICNNMYNSLCDTVEKGIADYLKNHHLCFEISIAWDDEDEFQHLGYYDSVDDAIEALLKYKKVNIEK